MVTCYVLFEFNILKYQIVPGYDNIQYHGLVAWTLVTGQWQEYFGIVVIAIRRAVMLLRQRPINISRKTSIRCLSWEIARVSWLRVVLDAGVIPPPCPLPSLPLLDSCLDFWIAEPYNHEHLEKISNFIDSSFTNETNRFIVISEQKRNSWKLFYAVTNYLSN